MIGLGTALKQMLRLDGAPVLAGLALGTIDQEQGNQDQPGSPVSASLRVEHTLFVHAVSELRAALRDEPVLDDPSIVGRGLIPSIDVSDTVMDAKIREARWWQIRTTGRPQPPADCAGMGSVQQSVCEFLDGATPDQQETAIAAGEPDPTGDLAAAAQDMTPVIPAVVRARHLAAVALRSAGIQAAVFVALAVTTVLVWAALRRALLRRNRGLPAVGYAAAFSPRRTLLQRAPFAVGAIAAYALLSAAAAAILFGANGTLFTSGVRLGLVGSGCVGLVVAFPLWRVCRAGAAPDAATRLALDGRPPVLYLRSTGDEEAVEVDSPVQDSGLVNVLTREETLARLLYRIGPVITLGRNDVRGAPFGMACLEVHGDARADVLRQLLREARLVLIHASARGETAGELLAAIETLTPERVVLLVQGGAGCATALHHLNPILPRPVPTLPRNQVEGPAWVRFVVYFRPDWTPVVWGIPPEHYGSTGELTQGFSLASALRAALSEPAHAVSSELSSAWTIVARRAAPLLAAVFVIGFAQAFWGFLVA